MVHCVYNNHWLELSAAFCQVVSAVRTLNHVRTFYVDCDEDIEFPGACAARTKNKTANNVPT